MRDRVEEAVALAVVVAVCALVAVAGVLLYP